MMKIIHTSDWHLGHELYSYDRTEEHEAFLQQLKQLVADEQPDALLVSGDIYHNATPSNAVMKMFTDRLDEIRNACPSMQIVVTAGNHDSGARLDVNRKIWNHLNVYMVARIARKDDKVDFDRHIIGIRNKQGEVCGYVVALPHVFPHMYPMVSEDTPREERESAFFQALADRVKEVNKEQLPVVMMAHMAIAGSDVTGHDTSVGGMDYEHMEDLKVDFDYLALGHIHCPQNLDGNRARYCGSPIPVSFDENYGHSVTVVELQRKGEEPVLRLHPIKNPWPLKTLPKEAIPFDEALQLLEDFPSEEKAYIRLRVQLQDVPPVNAMERAQLAVKNKACRFCLVKWEHQQEEQIQTCTFADVNQMRQHSPVDIAELYYERKFQHPMDAELHEMLNQVVSEMKHHE